MKIFSWVANKISGKQEPKRSAANSSAPAYPWAWLVHFNMPTSEVIFACHKNFLHCFVCCGCRSGGEAAQNIANRRTASSVESVRRSLISWQAKPQIGASAPAQEHRAEPAKHTFCLTGGNVSECRNDEFSDWPQSLLAIGTFGNKQLEEEVAESSSANVQAMQDPAKFTEEEVDHIRREFEVLLQGNAQAQAEAQGSCEDEHVASKEHDGEDSNEKQRREQLMNREMIISKAREMVGKKKSAKLKPRSMASLLRLLVCKGGFTTPVLEPRNSFPQTRMEKLLKAILQKKIHPQNSNTVATRRHLDWKLDEKEINECLEDALRDLDDDDDGAKWVKTDSDFIVLEM